MAEEKMKRCLCLGTKGKNVCGCGCATCKVFKWCVNKIPAQSRSDRCQDCK